MTRILPASQISNSNNNEGGIDLRGSASSASSSGSMTNIPRLCWALLASITTGGTTYAFGLYGSALKHSLGLSQSQLDTISTANFLAGLASFAPGMVVDRFGSRLGLTSGGISGATSLLLYWGVSTGRLMTVETEAEKTLVVAILSFLGVSTFLSCALITGAVFKLLSISCGPGTKGSAVGVAKGYVGLGSGCFAAIFESLRQPGWSDLNFLPLAAFFFLTCATLPSYFWLDSVPSTEPVLDVLGPWHFRVLYASLCTLAIVIVTSSLEHLWHEEHHSSTSTTDTQPNYFVTALLVVVWISPIAIQGYLPHRQHTINESSGEDAIRERDSLLMERSRSQDGEEETSDEELEITERLPNDEADDTDDNLESTNDSQCNASVSSSQAEQQLHHRRNGLLPQDDDLVQATSTTVAAAQVHSQRPAPPASDITQKNLAQMLQTGPAWLMLWTATILVGGGTVETNNLGQMVESLGFSPTLTATSLALFSVAQATGRVTFGAISESALQWKNGCCGPLPRPFFLVVASILGVFAHSILAVAKTEAAFVVGITLSGLAFGSVWPLLVLIVGEIFGTAHVGANYMFYDGSTSAGGTLLLSKVIAQDVYEDHVAPGDGVTCYGQACFQLTHRLIAMLSVTCIFTSGIMLYSTRHIYRK